MCKTIKIGTVNIDFIGELEGKLCLVTIKAKKHW